jgi:hypothetical protein
MKKFTLIVSLMAAALLAQGCVSTKGRKVTKNKLKIPKQTHSYALMEDESLSDPEVVRRGNKVRGTNEY